MPDGKPSDDHAWYVGEVIKEAKAGSPDDAREALRLFVNAVTYAHYGANDPEAELLAHVADCLRQYLEQGEDLERAFGVKRRRQRPKDAPQIVAQSIARAAAVEYLMRNGYGKTEAVETVAHAMRRDRSTVMDDCKGWLGGSLPDKHLHYLALPVLLNPDFPRLTPD